MEVMLEARGHWEAVDKGGVDRVDDRLAMEAIFRTVPPEMVTSLAKKTAKEAWNAIKTMRVGSERSRKATAQKVRKDYEAISFRDGESIDDFAMRLTGIVHQLEVFGDPVDDGKVVSRPSSHRSRSPSRRSSTSQC